MEQNWNLKSDHFQSSFLFFLVFLPLLYIQKTYPGKMFIKQNLKSCTIPKALLLPSVSRSFFSNYLFRVCSLLPRYIIVLIVLIEEDFLVSCRICVFSLLQLALWLQPSKVSFSFPGQCPIVHITKSNPCLIRLLMNIQIAWMFCCNNILKHLIIISQHVPNAKLRCQFESEALIIVPFKAKLLNQQLNDLNECWHFAPNGIEIYLKLEV